MDKFEFIVLEDNGIQQFLECPACANQFEINMQGLINLVWDRQAYCYKAKCPSCQKEEN